MIRVEEARLLAACGELRRKVAECERLARDVKIRLVYEELLADGDGPNAALRKLAERFNLSRSHLKRVIRRLESPEAREKRLRSPSRPIHRPRAGTRRASPLPRAGASGRNGLR